MTMRSRPDDQHIKFAVCKREFEKFRSISKRELLPMSRIMETFIHVFNEEYFDKPIDFDPVSCEVEAHGKRKD